MPIINKIEKELPPATFAEATKQQTGTAHNALGALGVIGMPSAIPGYSEPPMGTYDVYRRIDSHPTVAIARLASTAAIYGVLPSFEADKSAPPGAKEFIEKTIRPLWSTIINDALLALKYGYQADEKIYDIDRDGRIRLCRLKQLNPDLSEIIVDDHGGYLGLKNKGVDLPARKTWLYTNDKEAGNLYGRSRHENIRASAWHPWTELAGKQGQYVSKVAAVIPLIKYPEGTSKDATGKEVSNFQMAQQVLANLTKGHGIAMPHSLAKWAERFANAGVDVAQLAAWQLSFLEPGSDMLGSIIGGLKYFDALMLRGWFVPEGAVSDGQVGSRARTQANVDITIAMSQRDLNAIVRSGNEHIVDDLLVLNWGESARGTGRVKTEPLDDDKAALQRRIVEKVLTSEPTPRLLMETVDVAEMIASQNLPSAKSRIDPGI